MMCIYLMIERRKVGVEDVKIADLVVIVAANIALEKGIVTKMEVHLEGIIEVEGTVPVQNDDAVRIEVALVVEAVQRLHEDDTGEILPAVRDGKLDADPLIAGGGETAAPQAESVIDVVAADEIALVRKEEGEEMLAVDVALLLEGTLWTVAVTGSLPPPFRQPPRPLPHLPRRPRLMA